MSFKYKIFAIVMAAVLAIMTFGGCSLKKTDSDDSGTSVFDEDMFTERDLDASYDESSSAKIALADGATKSDSDNVKTDGDAVEITGEGTYIISGTLTNGRIIINAKDSDKIQLVLNGANISCDTGAAIYVKQADKVFITLAPSSENTLSNKREFVAVDDNNIDSVIFSKSDLTLNGSGELTVNAAYGHGIVSKDDLVLTGGEYSITSEKQALSGKDSIRVADGTYTLNAGKDGLHSENTDDTSKGFIYIANGTFDITCDCDGIDASGTVTVKNGNINITSGGGSENAEKKSEEFFPGGRNQQNQSAEQTTEQSDSVSAKGIKADGNLTIVSGEFSINSADDAIHSNSSITVSGGTYKILTGDDGIHADANLTVTNGTLNIEKSYEGLEGQAINISGGTISIVSDDDGMNAAGGNDESGFGGKMMQDDFSTDENSSITISGGKITINASGDGIDSNGNFYVKGGEIYVSGPENDGNGALDYSGDAQITGGTIVAAGMSGMAQNFGSSSTQGSILLNVSSRSSGAVTVKDSSGSVIISFTPEKEYNSVVISSPDIKKGETYTVTAAGESQTVEMSDIIYSSAGSATGNPGGGQNPGGGHGQTPPDNQNNGGTPPEKPSGERPQKPVN